MSRIGILAFLGCTCCFAQTSEEIVALAKTYFRDSAELPMDAAVTTTVRDASGKTKSEKRATVHILFHGYSHTGQAAVNVKSGMLDRAEMFDGLTASIAAIAPGIAIVKPNEKSSLEVLNATVRITDRDCPAFALNSPRILFPKGTALCGIWTYTLEDGPDGRTFRQFTFSGSNLPARGTVPQFGDVDILSFGINEDFQSWTMTGEKKPFLLPKRVAISLRTTKGTVDISGDYTPR